jgi:hypothetical protein
MKADDKWSLYRLIFFSKYFSYVIICRNGDGVKLLFYVSNFNIVGISPVETGHISTLYSY